MAGPRDAGVDHHHPDIIETEDHHPVVECRHVDDHVVDHQSDDVGTVDLALVHLDERQSNVIEHLVFLIGVVEIK